MYQKAYGIIETLAPLHVGASAGEETGNLNLIFRDQFTQTGIIPGSSIRGRFRADMRSLTNGAKLANIWYGHDSDPDESEAEESTENEADKILKTKDHTTEALVQRSARQCGTIEKKLRGSNVPFIQRYSRKNC